MSIRTVVTAPLLGALGLALAATALHAAPWCARAGAYDLEQFELVPGTEFGNYVALSNGARLAMAFDGEFLPVGVIEGRGKSQVFRVGTSEEGYSWYWGINDHGTTVGFTQSWSDFAVSAWMRDRKGNVRTFSDPAGDVYLYRVNEEDLAVGEVVYGPDLFRPVIASRHGMKVVDPAGVDPDHPAYFAGINDAGAIVGGTFDPDTWEHTCLLWDRCGVTAIDHDEASLVAPRAINSRGQIAGFWTEPDLVIGERTHGFIRDRDGTFRTVDIEYPWDDEIDVGGEEPALLVDQTTKILDLNDHGQILIEATGWYLELYEIDGDVFDFVFPVWTYAIGTPERRGGVRCR